jgi:hypothetical protein
MSVEDLPPVDGLDKEQAKERQKALAQVRVTTVVKGECDRTTLLVLGGPYATCAWGNYYVHFEKGERLFLVLDSLLEVGKEAIIITHYNRVQKVSPSTMAGYMASARSAWQAAVNRHRAADPQAMEQASARLAAAQGHAVEIAATDRYPVLACLRLLLNDPDHLPPPSEHEEIDWNYGLSHGQVLSKASHPAIVVTSPGVHPVSLPGLTQAIARRQAEHPAEVGDFNARLLTTLLVDELSLSTKLCRRLLEDPAVQNTLSVPQFDPLWMSMPVSPNSPLAESVAALLMLAAPEPDNIRHGAFGHRQRDEKLMPEVFLPYLEKHRLPDLAERREIQQLLLRLPCPEAAALLRGRVEVNAFTAESIFMFFAQAGTSDDLAPILDWQESEIDRFVQAAALLAPQTKERQRRCHADNLARMKSTLAACNLKETQAYRRVLALSIRLALMD